jgi:tRNA (guanine-N7-)-methyltransferase
MNDSVPPCFDLTLEALPRDAEGRVLWGQIFGVLRPLRLEIGVGNSPFLIDVARREPDFNYLGFEYSPDRVRKFLRKVAAAELTCIRILRRNASLVLPSWFEPGTVDHIFINHPDPWPKRRHAKRRFVVPENARLMASLLRPGGGISLRTDHAAYAKQMLEVLDAVPELENLAGRGVPAAGPLCPIPTPYQLKVEAAGVRIHFLEYWKKMG